MSERPDTIGCMEIGRVKIEHIPDPDQDVGYLQPLPEDDLDVRARKQARLDALERGDWSPIGVVAKVRVGWDTGTALFQSSGVWGVESDGPAIGQIEREQIERLRETLVSALGASVLVSEAIQEAILGP